MMDVLVGAGKRKEETVAWAQVFGGRGGGHDEGRSNEDAQKQDVFGKAFEAGQVKHGPASRATKRLC
jgi:hypothetical protein